LLQNSRVSKIEIGEAFDHGHVVGDVKNGKRKMIAQLFPLRPPIQRRKWLIHRQDFRLGEQGTANADELTLPAG